MDWTWKVFRRDDGSVDFIPSDEQTRFEIVKSDISLRDAMALADEINANREQPA